MTKPLGCTTLQEAFNPTEDPLLVWTSIVDKRYLAQVHRTDEYYGTLYLFDGNDDMKELMHKVVGLAYGARFGPDVDDVAQWQYDATIFIDETLNAKSILSV